MAVSPPRHLGSLTSFYVPSSPSTIGILSTDCRCIKKKLFRVIYCLLLTRHAVASLQKNIGCTLVY